MLLISSMHIEAGEGRKTQLSSLSLYKDSTLKSAVDLAKHTDINTILACEWIYLVSVH